MAKWMEAVKNLYKPRECPVCGYGITVKQRWQMPITRLRAWKCPGCQTELYLKGFLPCTIYILICGAAISFTYLFILRTYTPYNLFGTISTSMSCAGLFFLLLPSLPIALRHGKGE